MARVVVNWSQRPYRQLSGPAPGARGHDCGRGLARQGPPVLRRPRLGQGRNRRARPRCAGSAGQFWTRHCRPAPGHRRRQHLLHAGQRHSIGGGALGRVQHFLLSARSGRTVFPQWSRPPRTSPSAPSASTACRRRRLKPIFLGLARRQGFPVTLIHPGHIVGQGWSPLNPAGHFDDAALPHPGRGANRLALPNFGMDGAPHPRPTTSPFSSWKAMANWSVAVGEAFHAVSPGAVTLRHYAEAMSRWFGHEPNLTSCPGKSGRPCRPRRTPRPPGSISPAARTARSRREGACSATRRAIHRLPPYRNRSPGSWPTASSRS